MEDSLIIDLYFKRDEDAIKETDLKYGKLAYMVSYNIVRDHEDSKDLVNDTYVSLWNQIPPTRPNNFKAFICKVTRNLSLKRLEYKLANKRNSDLETSFDDLENLIPDEEIDTSLEDLANLISKFLKSEKKEARVIFIRKYFFNDSIEEIARKYEFSEAKVKSMLLRSRNKLKKYLIKEGVINE